MLNFISIASLILLAGCSSISSYSTESEDKYVRNAAGSYYLQKHLLKIVIAGDKTTMSQVVVADTNTNLRVGFSLSPLANDNIKVTYTSQGLLSTVNSTNNSQLVGIINNFAEVAGFFRSTSAEKIKVTQLIFDPFDPVDAKLANKFLQNSLKNDSCVSIEIVRGLWSPGCVHHPYAGATGGRGVSVSNHTSSGSAELNVKHPGLYYRRQQPHRVFLRLSGTLTQTQSINFAQMSPVFRLDVKRSPFVNRITDISFSHGELTSVQVQKPSEVLAISALPATIIAAYLKGITSGLDFNARLRKARIDKLNAEAQFLRDQSAAQANRAAARSEIANDPRTAILANDPSFNSGALQKGQSGSTAQGGVLDENYFNSLGACRREVRETIETCDELVRAARSRPEQ